MSEFVTAHPFISVLIIIALYQTGENIANILYRKAGKK